MSSGRQQPPVLRAQWPASDDQQGVDLRRSKHRRTQVGLKLPYLRSFKPTTVSSVELIDKSIEEIAFVYQDGHRVNPMVEAILPGCRLPPEMFADALCAARLQPEEPAAMAMDEHGARCPRRRAACEVRRWPQARADAEGLRRLGRLCMFPEN